MKDIYQLTMYLCYFLNGLNIFTLKIELTWSFTVEKIREDAESDKCLSTNFKATTLKTILKKKETYIEFPTITFPSWLKVTGPYLFQNRRCQGPCNAQSYPSTMSRDS